MDDFDSFGVEMNAGLDFIHDNPSNVINNSGNDGYFAKDAVVGLELLNSGTGNSISNPEAILSFGMNPIALQHAAQIKQFASDWDGTVFAAPLNTIADWLSGANKPGMEIIIDHVCEISKFFHIDPVNVCYEAGEPGMQWGGYTNEAYDNWIGGDPKEIDIYATQYGDLFPVGVVAHEMGHHLVDLLFGNIPRRAHEACADYVAGLYFGAKNLDPTGMEGFFADHGGGNYPDNRDEIFMEAVQKAGNYGFRDFIPITDDPRFNLRDELWQIAQRYIIS